MSSLDCSERSKNITGPVRPSFLQSERVYSSCTVLYAPACAHVMRFWSSHPAVWQRANTARPLLLCEMQDFKLTVCNNNEGITPMSAHLNPEMALYKLR